MELTSSAFKNQAEIPEKYTCEGENISPPLSIAGVPEGVQSLTLIMHDPDVPREIRQDGVYDHWIMFNIIPNTTELAEGDGPGLEGKNSSGSVGYTGPCPPRGYEPAQHRYIFTLYALKSELPLAAGVSKEEVLEAMQGLVVEKSELVGTYEKKK